jgi:hypothetical protein
MAEGSIFFFEKKAEARPARTKKLVFIVCVYFGRRFQKQKFFASFFQKRSAFLISFILLAWAFGSWVG